MRREWSIARRLFVAHALFIVVLSGLVATILFVEARDRGYDETSNRMLAVATAIADSPLVLAASEAADPSTMLQPYALELTQDAGLDFITIMAPDRTRWTHPNAAEIGQDYIGAIQPAVSGTAFTEISTGTLGPSVRAVVPVTDAGDTVRALVAVGTTTTNISIALNAQLPSVLGLALALLASGSVGTWLLGRYLRRVTLGWGPEHLAQLFVYYDSVLRSVREGLVLVDLHGDLVLYNDQAATLLGIPPRPAAGSFERPQALTALSLPPSLGDLLRSGRNAHDEIHVTGTRVLVVNQEPATASGNAGARAEPMGFVATIRDHTDLQNLGSELQSMRTLSDALRAQTHEHSNRLHTIVSLMELGRTEQALEFATKDLELSQRLADEMVGSVDEPVISALIMGKSAQANELGITLTVTASGTLAQSGLSIQDLVTVLGNLVDNALDAAAGGDDPRRVSVTVSSTEQAVVIEVADSGAGVALDVIDEVLRLGFSTKGTGPVGGRGLGLALVRQAVTRLGGTLTIGRREGAVFTVTIPAIALPAAPLPAAADTTAAPTPPETLAAAVDHD
ncbi:sensor histidine kinase [Cryobacterium levicorallinum]|uniref:Sensor-like histidine kinase SenX3 n=1 Tax=Cryobacterium levicorallinum TaxID=995038 RepID=A0A1I3AIH1_9MICO|nr:sensor histidine kinase [Cryobacterium levicorallinum]TFB86574.1 sensor histidine kinase [Cryobacterium levicorallinum]GEP26580.1 histidine kinase [Cryobacterium levicorallinum]SFH49131.1 Sensor histidine kinase regulating citrate/malate metabolism [Cryobacterium levicorallinum]